MDPQLSLKKTIKFKLRTVKPCDSTRNQNTNKSVFCYNWKNGIVSYLHTHPFTRPNFHRFLQQKIWEKREYERASTHATTRSSNALKISTYLRFPTVKTIMKLRVDFVVIVKFSVGSQSDKTQAHERGDECVISRIAREIELDAVPIAVESPVVFERPFHFLQHGLPYVDLRLHDLSMQIGCNTLH